MLGVQRDGVTSKARRYKTGLQKLYETNQVCQLHPPYYYSFYLALAPPSLGVGCCSTVGASPHVVLPLLWYPGTHVQVVVELQAKLTKLQPVLKKAAEDTEALLVELSRDQKDADAAAEVAAKDEAETSAFARQVAAIKADCQRDLDEVGN